ncbi:LPS-assembly protein LptD [Zavarzinia sp. CC-PAN008]|uniref:LPS-assembly protein LptD n=1 Tax=Zavarzinia sp. CC-PAN008 TaxID=3243332 RepID=UPI003F742ACC
MRRMTQAVMGACVLAAPAVAVPDTARAQEQDQPVLIHADQVVYDERYDTVTATGRVQLEQGDRVLMADRVTFQMAQDVVTAQGNVALMEPSGDVLFGEQVELQDEFKNGTIQSIRILLIDNSRMAAQRGSRVDGNTTNMERVVYSPCDLCQDNPTAAPLWQIKAFRVIHDEKDKEIRYEDAVFEVYGVPIFYTPYFAHPDPTVKRKSGFLIPDYGRSTDLGFRIAAPYYWAINDSSDVTLTPTYYSDAGALLSFEYRQMTETGEFNIRGSGTITDRTDANGNEIDGDQFRGHLFADGRFKLSEAWSWGFNIQRSTDDTYLRRYEFGGGDSLTSTLFLEMIDDRDFAQISTYSYQGLRETDDPGLTPTILPLIEVSLISKPDDLGGRFSFDFNALALERSEGTDSRRLSSAVGWLLPYTNDLGQVWTASANVRADIYNSSDVVDVFGVRHSGGTYGRVLPQAAIDWRWPFVRSDGEVRQVIEPIAALVLAPYGGNPAEIPNEDSTSFEFDDTNVFQTDRFTGIDRWENGPHAMLGLQAGVYGPTGGSTSVMLGQAFRLKASDVIPVGSGLDDTRSDYVGRIDVRPSEFIDLTHRFRIDRDTLDFERNEIRAVVGPQAFKVQVSYVSLAGQAGNLELPDREELYMSVNAKLDRFWSATASARQDLITNVTLTSGIGLIYRDECIEFGTFLSRRETRDRDIEPSTSLNFRIRLQNLS